MSEFLTYEQVREKFGCKSDTPIKNAIKAGKLTRVYLSKSVKSARITADSVAKFLNAVMEEKATLKDFNVGNGQWAAWKEAKAHEDEAKALGTDPQAHMTPAEKDFIANNSVVIGDLGFFVPTMEWTKDPITKKMVPPNCFLDETDTPVCGIQTPLEANRCFHARCRAHGVSPTKALYVACHLDSSGHWKVSDMQPKPETPSLEFTQGDGRIGVEQVVPPKGFLETHQTRVSGGVM